MTGHTPWSLIIHKSDPRRVALKKKLALWRYKRAKRMRV